MALLSLTYLSTISRGITLQPKRPLPTQGRGVNERTMLLDPRLIFRLTVLYLLFSTNFPMSVKDLKFR